MTAKKLITKTEFAKLCGVSTAAITNACNRKNCGLHEALINNKIDPDHPEAQNYKNNRRPHPTKIKQNHKTKHVRGTAAKKQQRKNESLAKLAAKERGDKIDDENELMELPEDIEAFKHYTLQELVERFGTDTAFSEWLSAMQKIEIIKEKTLKNAETEKRLVSRELIKIGIIEPVNVAHERMLTDGVQNIATRVKAMVEAGKTIEEIQDKVADTIASFIRPIKAKVKRTLNNVEKD